MRTTALENVAAIQLGKMLSPLAKTGKAPFPYLRNQNVQWNHIDLSDLATMDFSEAERAKFELKAGDLLVCEGGEPGRCAIWKDELANCYYQKAIHRVRPHKEFADSEFLSLWIWFQCSFGELSKSNSKTTIAHLPLARLKQLKVPELSIEEQRKIVSKVRPQLTLLNQCRTACKRQLSEVTKLGHSLVFASVRAENTARQRLGDILAEVRDGIGRTWTKYPVLGATRSGLAPAKEKPGKNPERYKPVGPGTVFYNPMRITIGSIAFVDDDDKPGITSPDYVALKGKPGVVDSRWFYHWLRSPLGEKCIISLARGAVRERMLFNRLAEGEIELPGFTAQEKASRALAQIKPLRAGIEQQMEELELIPRKLLAQVFEN
jgi:type I restriction enzyme S subunit